MKYTTYIMMIISVFLNTSCGNKNTAQIQAPVPPLYQDASNIIQDNDPHVHITVYETRASLDDIFSFYDDSLINEGWEFRNQGVDQDNNRYAGYGILTKGPAFALLIRAKNEGNGINRVELKQTISGPFAWPSAP